MTIIDLDPTASATERREACERILLTKQERTLLKSFYRHPVQSFPRMQVASLIALQLVEPTETPGFYRTTELYSVYREYLRIKYRDLTLSSLWLPILVSLTTTAVIDVLQWLLLPTLL